MTRFKRMSAALLLWALLSASGLSEERLVTTGQVYLRDGPGRDNAALDIVPENVALDYTRAEKDARDKTWYCVTYEGQVGWIAADYAELDNASETGERDEAQYTSSEPGNVITTGSVSLREGAGLENTALDVVQAGERLRYDQSLVDARGVTWYRILYRGQLGWISSRYARADADSIQFVRASENARIRLGPGLYYDAVGTLIPGRSLIYSGTARRDDRGVVWYQVSYRGGACWVSSKYTFID